MSEIHLKNDASIFREALERRIKEIAAEDAQPPSAIEVGYEISQAGWVFIHADRRPEHERDGEWTSALDNDNIITIPDWNKALEAYIHEDEEPLMYKMDGDELDEEDAAEAVGMMIYEVLMQAKKDGVFDHPGWSGKVQLDIEDFDGAWGWPDYDDLGKKNLV